MPLQIPHHPGGYSGIRTWIEEKEREKREYGRRTAGRDGVEAVGVCVEHAAFAIVDSAKRVVRPPW